MPSKLKTYTGHSDFVYAVAFRPNGKKLASASKDRIVHLFETETGKSLFTFSGMDEDVMAWPSARRQVASFRPALKSSPLLVEHADRRAGQGGRRPWRRRP